MDDLHHIHPVGYISMHAGDHDAYGVVRSWIMTDLGWRLADGRLYDRKTFPRLWAALPNRRRGNLVEVPDLRPGRVELQPHQMPAHVHRIAPNLRPPSPHMHTFVGYDPGSLNHNHGIAVSVDSSGQFRPVRHHDRHPQYFSGHTDSANWPPHPEDWLEVEKVREDDRGLHVKLKLDDSQYVDTIAYLKRDMKRMLEAEISQAIIGPNHARSILGLAPITSKENNMSGTTKLKTPTKNIKRKDLAVAMRLLGLSDQDDLLNAIAIVQELEEGQKVYRAHELQGEKINGVNIKVINRDIEGLLTDAQGVYIRDEVKLVVDGKMVTIAGTDFVVTSPAGDVGSDTLRMVGGN